MNSKILRSSSTMTELPEIHLKMFNVLITIKKYLRFDCDNSSSSRICPLFQINVSSIQKMRLSAVEFLQATFNSDVHLSILVFDLFK